MDLGVRFNPKEGAIDPLGLEVSLKVGDCSAKMDLLKILLDKVYPSHPVAIQQSMSPVSPYASHLFFPPAASRGQVSPTFPSPHSVRTSLFSPASLFSPSTIMSSNTAFVPPTSADLPHLPSPRSPSSPFLQAISVSLLDFN